MIDQTNPLREPCRALREKEQDFLSVFTDNFIYSYRARIKGRGGEDWGKKEFKKLFFTILSCPPSSVSNFQIGKSKYINY